MSSPQVIGWEPMQAEWWLTIRASLPKPWPREAVLMDLRFWRGQEVATAHRAERLQVHRPGRPTLLKEWGWTDWAVKEAFKAEDEWARPGVEVAASEPPAHRQLPTSPPPDVARLEAKNIEESASPPPATHQPTASEPPRARSLLRDPEVQRSEIRSEVRPSAIPAQAPQVHLFPPIGFPPSEPLQAPALAETPPPAPEAPIKHPGAVSGASEEKPAALPPDLMAVWQAYRFHHPSCGATPPSGSVRILKRSLKDFTAEQLVAVIRWFHDSDDSTPVFMRGKKLWGLDNILRIEKLPDRVEAASQPWQQVQSVGAGPIILDPEGNVEPMKPQKAAANRANSIDSAASTYNLAQQLRAEEEAHHGFGG